MKKTFLVTVTVFTLLLLSSVVGAQPSIDEQLDQEEPLVIVVTASRIPQALEEVPVSVEIIDRKAIEQSGAETLGDALRLASGVTVHSNGGRGAAQQPFIRGSTSPQVLILLDGAPVVSPQGAFTLTHIPTGIIERIEVVKGPGSALYGADAVGGVINVITRSAASVERGSRMRIKGGPGELEYLATAAGSFGDAAFGLTAGYVDLKGYRPNTDYKENHLRIRFDREFSTTSEGYVQFSWLGGRGGSPDPVNASWGPANGRQRDSQARTEFSYTKEFPDGQIQSLLYGRRYERDYNSDFEASRHRSTTIGGELQRDFDLDGGRITVGVTARVDRATSTNLQGGEASTTAGALFGQWITDIHENVALTTGLRIDSHSAYSAPISPRVGLRAKLGSDTSLRVSAGRSFRAPTLDDLYWNPSMFDEGNPNLKPEDGWSYEIGVGHVGDFGAMDLAFFHRRITNLISWEEGNDDLWRPMNVAESKTRGMEVELTIPITSSLDLATSWTYLDARNVQSDARLPWIPRLEGVVKAHYTAGPLIALGTVRYRGTRPSGTTEQLPAYGVLDVKVSRSVSPEAEIFIEGYNLLDHEYEETLGYPMPGRRVMLGASYRF